MSKVAIVTDSTTGFPAEVTQRYPMFIAPLQVIWGKNTYQDSIDIQPTEFYERLEVAEEMPSTSQPSPQVFFEFYQRLLDEGHDIISMHISSKLSGTINSAVQAKAMLDNPSNIAIYDSKSTSMGLGFHVMRVAEAIRAGADLQECVDIAENLKKHTGIYFVVNTLEFLHRGGRIGGASAFLGTLLDLKPILELNDGAIEAVEKVRTQKKALNRMVELIEKQANGSPIQNLAVLHANAATQAKEVLLRAQKQLNVKQSEDLICTDVSPVIGTHTGPGCIGLAFTTA